MKELMITLLLFVQLKQIPYEVLNKVMSRIINEVRGVNRVMYDITSKPPGTIEFE